MILIYINKLDYDSEYKYLILWWSWNDIPGNLMRFRQKYQIHEISKTNNTSYYQKTMYPENSILSYSKPKRKLKLVIGRFLMT